MRKLIIISLLVAVAVAANAQAGIQRFTLDTIKGAKSDTLTPGKKCVDVGLITFDFTLDGFGTDSCTVFLQGSNDAFTTHTAAVSSQAYKSATATTYQLGDNPNKFLNYRLIIKGVATDTVRYTNAIFIYKK